MEENMDDYVIVQLPLKMTEGDFITTMSMVAAQCGERFGYERASHISTIIAEELSKFADEIIEREFFSA